MVRAASLLLGCLFVASCAHRAPREQPMERGAETRGEPAFSSPTTEGVPEVFRFEPPTFPPPVTGIPVFPDVFTGAAAWPDDATGEVARPAERPSPAPVGAENLAWVPEAASPSRAASLNLAQEGRLAWLNRDRLAARQKLQSALQIWGHNPYAQYYLGLLDLEAGNYAQAASFAQSAIRSLRGNPFWNARAHLLLAEAYEALGNGHAAFLARAKADELDPRVRLK